MLSAHHHLPLWHMAKKMVVKVVRKDKIAQFQVRHISYQGLNQNKAFKYQVEIN